MVYNRHIPVLCNEAINALNIRPDSICLDMTLGRGGHSSRILEKIPKGHLYATDKDINALDYSRKRLEAIAKNFTLYHLPFSKFIDELQKEGLKGADCILFDIGVSSPQFDDPSRGFSYRFDAKLDMRMNQEQKLTAYDVVNTYSLNDLTRIIYEYGEDPSARRIAANIVKRREIAPIETTLQLVDVIKESLPSFILNKKGHPAKQTFQAIRYEVNNEKGELEEGLKKGIDYLNVGGRLAIITFNSLEDRIVKDLFKSYTSHPSTNRYLPDDLSLGEIKYSLVNKKPITPSQKELSINPRALPSKLRVIERIKA